MSFATNLTAALAELADHERPNRRPGSMAKFNQSVLFIDPARDDWELYRQLAHELNVSAHFADNRRDAVRQIGKQFYNAIIVADNLSDTRGADLIRDIVASRFLISSSKFCLLMDEDSSIDEDDLGITIMARVETKPLFLSTLKFILYGASSNENSELEEY